MKGTGGEDEKADLKGAKIDTIAPQEYNGTAQYPDFTLISKDKNRTNYKYNETSKKYGCTTTDGTTEAIKAAVTLSNNTNMGTATILLTGGVGKNGKATTIKTTFKITPVDLSAKGEVVLSDTAVSYSVKDVEIYVIAEAKVKVKVKSKEYTGAEIKLADSDLEVTMKGVDAKLKLLYTKTRKPLA